MLKWLLTMLVLPLPAMAADRVPADMVIRGGSFYTVDERQPRASAVAIRDGRFVMVGEDPVAEGWIGEHTQVIQLNGNPVLPGLVDGHTHPGILALFDSVELAAAPASESSALLTWLAQYAGNNPDIPFLIAGFWRTGEFGVRGPHKSLIDAVVPDRPVALLDDSGHSMWLNSAALEVMGIDRDTPDPAPGLAYYQRDKNGEPTGWIKEFTMAVVQERVLDTADPEVFERNLEKFVRFLSRQGVTSLYDGGNLGLHDKVYAVLAKLEREGRLPLRYEGTFHVHLPGQLNEAIPELKRLQRQYGGDRLNFNTIKIHFDGVHEIRTSAVLEPFAGDPGNKGGTLVSEARLAEFIRELHREKIDLHLHVVGDRATRIALDAYEQVPEARGDYPRLTLCHLELVDDADIARFSELGVVANFTPHWFGDLFQGGEHTLGERNDHKMRARSFFDAGATVSFSSDVVTPEEPLRASPFVGMQVGHNRQDIEGGADARRMPPPSQRLGLEQLVQGYTAGGAYQLRASDELGSITVGKRAALVILGTDIFTADPFRIHKTRVLGTMVDGDFVSKSGTNNSIMENTR